MKRSWIHKNRLWHLLMAAMLFGIGNDAVAQNKVTFLQNIYILKTLIPNLKTVGVLGANIKESDVQKFTRAGLGLGIKIAIGIPKNASEISSIYKKMVNEMKIQALFIPDPEDDMLLKTGFEYLRSNSVLDKVCFCVPTPDLLVAGAMCSVQNEDGKTVVYINQKIASLLSVELPHDPESVVQYVSR